MCTAANRTFCCANYVHIVYLLQQEIHYAELGSFKPKEPAQPKPTVAEKTAMEEPVSPLCVCICVSVFVCTCVTVFGVNICLCAHTHVVHTYIKYLDCSLVWLLEMNSFVHQFINSCGMMYSKLSSQISSCVAF